MRRLAAVAFLASVSLAAAAVGQPVLSPGLLLITQESVKPGKAGAYARNRAAVSRALERAGSPRISIALKAISGPDEVWRLDFAGALADLETEVEQLANTPELRSELEALAGEEADFLSGKHRVTALYQSKVSYQPDFDWTRVRYVDMIAIHVRPGRHPEYNELRRMSKAAHDKGGLAGPLLIYKANSGVQGLVWMVVRPLTSLRQHDELRAQGFGEPLTDAEDKRMTDLRAASMEYAEERFFRVVPELSNVPRSWDGAGAPFWNKR